MCGIVGYIGAEKAAPIILSGLSKLEYRGYDSSGMAVSCDGKVRIIKRTGKLAGLYDAVGKEANLNGTLAIGHTRWATHGRPTLENAHPHVSRRFAIVHNGIIENDAELKEKYLNDIIFKSDTDTETVVHLMQTFTDNGESVEEAIRHIIAEVKGSYALAVIDSDNPDVLYAVKNKSPLLAGLGKGFNMIGSDAMAMISETGTFLEIYDGEYAVITRESVKIYKADGEEIKRETYTAEIDASDVEKGTYRHYMLKEIEEQPAVIHRIINEYSDENGEFRVDDEIACSIKACDKIYLIACGTSYHAALIGKYYFEKIAGICADAYIASEFVYNMPVLCKKPLFIFISQSGETADCRAVLVKIKEMGFKSLVLTNVKNSTLSRESDYTLLLNAGPEIAVASTKAYTAQITVLAILACVVCKNKSFDLRYELSVAANVMDSLCLCRETYRKLAVKYLTDKRNCFYIGRSLDYYVCMEAALKLKEISYIQTEGFAAGELKHGTIALIEDGTPVMAVITQEKINHNTRSNMKEVKSRGANVLCISTQALSSPGDEIIIGNVNEYLAPLVSVIPAQYLAYYAALIRGCDIDKPRNLAKSVTVE